jgi:hypothetical protein
MEVTPKRIAICYWGLTRSTRYIYQTHFKNIFDILTAHNIEFDVFIHTWQTNAPKIWGRDDNIPIDYNEYLLLNPTEYKIDNQDDFMKTIVLEDYFYGEELNCPIFEDKWITTPWENPQLLRNHICALESQKRVTELCIQSGRKYDYIMYIRPDAHIDCNLPMEWLGTLEQGKIVLHSGNEYEGYNDRFAIMMWDNCMNYAGRLGELKLFRKNIGKINSEKFLKYIIDKYFTEKIYINFLFRIVRSNITVWKE